MLLKRDNNRSFSDIIESSILGFAIGDALGVPVEFQSRESLKNKKIVDMEEYGTHNQPKGTWSDDTSIVLATMDGIYYFSDKTISYKKIMDNFLDWKRNGKYTPFDRVFDIGNATSSALSMYEQNINNKKGNEVFCGLDDIYSNGNGSLMRILPVSLYLVFPDNYDYLNNNTFDIIKKCSSLTHAHSYSFLGCYIYNCYVAELIKTGDKKIAYDNLRESFARLNKDNFKYYDDLTKVYSRILFDDITKYQENDIRSSGYVVDTLEATMWCLLTTKDFKSAVLKAVNLGDDTDTIGALVGGLAGIIYGKKSIPKDWLESLQNKKLLDNIINEFIWDFNDARTVDNPDIEIHTLNPKKARMNLSDLEIFGDNSVFENENSK